MLSDKPKENHKPIPRKINYKPTVREHQKGKRHM